MKSLFLPLLCCCTAGSVFAAGIDADADAKRAALKFFENEVRPVLVNRCYECHAEKKQKGGLRVDNLGYMTTGGDSGAALVPGDPAKSLLIQVIRHEVEDLEMPPKEKLSDKEIAVLEKWVKL